MRFNDINKKHQTVKVKIMAVKKRNKQLGFKLSNVTLIREYQFFFLVLKHLLFF